MLEAILGFVFGWLGKWGESYIKSRRVNEEIAERLFRKSDIISEQLSLWTISFPQAHAAGINEITRYFISASFEEIETDLSLLRNLAEELPTRAHMIYKQWVHTVNSLSELIRHHKMLQNKAMTSEIQLQSEIISNYSGWLSNALTALSLAIKLTLPSASKRFRDDFEKK